MVHGELEIGDLVEVTAPGGRKLTRRVIRFHPAPNRQDHFMVEGYLWWFKEEEGKIIEEVPDGQTEDKEH